MGRLPLPPLAMDLKMASFIGELIVTGAGKTDYVRQVPHG